MTIADANVGITEPPISNLLLQGTLEGTQAPEARAGIRSKKRAITIADANVGITDFELRRNSSFRSAWNY